MPLNTLVIVNPASRAGRTGREWTRLSREVESVLGPVEIVRTRGPGDARALAREAGGNAVERLIVAGGDGTVGEVVTGLLEAGAGGRCAIGLLPFGSGWDFARSLGLPRDLAAALSVIEAGAIREIDAGRVEFRNNEDRPSVGYFANEVSAGLSGATVRVTGALSKRIGARLGFVLGAISAIVGHRPVDVAVEVDGERIYEGPTSMVVAANGAFFGAGMHVAPEARLDDGRLEVVLVRGMSMPRLLANLPSFYVGGHLKHPRVTRHAGRTLNVIPKHARSPIDLDGEAVGTLPLHVEILPRALRIFAPNE